MTIWETPVPVGPGDADGEVAGGTAGCEVDGAEVAGAAEVAGGAEVVGTGACEEQATKIKAVIEASIKGTSNFFTVSSSFLIIFILNDE